MKYEYIDAIYLIYYIHEAMTFVRLHARFMNEDSYVKITEINAVQKTMKLEAGWNMYTIYFNMNDGKVLSFRNVCENQCTCCSANEVYYNIITGKYYNDDKRLEELENKVKELEQAIKFLPVLSDEYKVANISFEEKKDNSECKAAKEKKDDD